MKENHLLVKIIKTKKYSPYITEIQKTVGNLIDRNFHSDKPNQKMLTILQNFQFQLERYIFYQS